MTRRLSMWLLLSLAIHTGLVGAGLYLVVGGAMPPALFIDLVHDLLDGVEGASPGRSGHGDQTPAARSHGEVAGRSASRAAEPPRRDREAIRAAAPARAEPDAPLPLTAPLPAPSFTPLPPPAPAAPRPAPGPDAAPSPGGTVAPSVAAGAAVEPTPSASAGGAGGDASAALAHGTGGDAAAGGRAVAREGGSGMGLGARGGSALAMAVPGDGGGDGAADAIYDELRRRVQAALVYPARARSRRLTGIVEIELDIRPSGEITRVRVAVSSSHPLLDEVAVDTVRGLGRVSFPPGIRPRVLRVRLPVTFAFR